MQFQVRNEIKECIDLETWLILKVAKEGYVRSRGRSVTSRTPHPVTWFLASQQSIVAYSTPTFRLPSLTWIHFFTRSFYCTINVNPNVLMYKSKNKKRKKKLNKKEKQILFIEKQKYIYIYIYKYVLLVIYRSCIYKNNQLEMKPY